jgi:hypothetical protein
MNKTLLLTYAENKLKIAKLEEENELIKDQCLKEIQALRGDTDSPIALEEYPGCSFTIMKRKTWTYSDYIKTSEAALKERKKEEEKTGDATFTETEHLIFKTPKE